MASVAGRALALALCASLVFARFGAGYDGDCSDHSCVTADSSLLQVSSVRGRAPVQTIGKSAAAAAPPTEPLTAAAAPALGPVQKERPAGAAGGHIVVALQALGFAAFVFYIGGRTAAWWGSQVPGAAKGGKSTAVSKAAPEEQSAESDDRCRAEMKVGGMTCSACSSTVERCLRMQNGVESAAVNLVLEKATVVFNKTVVSTEELLESVEDVGFVATLISQGPVAGIDEGHASLHLEASDGVSAADLAAAAGKLPGVLSASAADGRVVRVNYKPLSVGSRSLLKQLEESFPQHEIHCAPPQGNNEIVGLQTHAQNLWFNLKCSALPAAVVFVLTVVLPAAGIDLGTIDCLTVHIHTATAVVVVLSTPVQFVFGREFHVQARKALARGAPNMDVLVSLATSISFGYAMLVLLSKVCRAATGQQPMSYEEMLTMHHGGGAMPAGVHIGLGCHALHFFGMSPILITVVLCGKFIETAAKIHTMESLVRLMECKSQTAHLVLDDKEQVVPVELVHVGDKLRLYEGCQVPVDGELTSEASLWVNEAMLTGESAPVEKRKGSVVMGGTTVASGSGFIEATTIGSRTALGEILTLISNAQATKTRTQQLANTVASYFVTSVMACSVLVFLVWLSLIHMRLVALPPDMDSANSFDIALFAGRFGIAVLMVACPCAMGLATPTAVMVSTGVAARMGCLVKSAEALETGASVRIVVLDKTGTITEGAPRISGVALVPAVAALPAACFEAAAAGAWEQPAEGRLQRPPVEYLAGAPARSGGEAAKLERAFWQLVGTAEAGSDHPLAKCLVSAAQAASGCAIFPSPEQFRYKVGRGVSATIHGVDVRIGSLAFLEESLKELRQDLADDESLKQLEVWAAEKRESRDSVVIVHAVMERKVRLLGALAMRDALRADAKRTIRHLQKDLGLEVWMCTGDGRKTAQAIAKEVGIPEDRVHAEALPKHKAEKVEELKAKLAGQGSVCVVGDGVNDAPALAAADVGMAIGAGAHLAMEAADVVLVRSELSKLAAYIQLSKDSVFTIRRNFLWAFIFNFCGLPVAAGLFYPRVVLPPLAAGLAMGLSSALVVTSSLLLKRFQPPLLAP